VHSVLEEMGCRNKPTVMALNKADRVRDRSYLDVLRARYSNSVPVSAKNGSGLDDLERAVTETLAGEFVDVEVQASAGNGKLLAYLKSHAIEQSRMYDDGRLFMHCRLPRHCLGQVVRLHGNWRTAGNGTAWAVADQSSELPIRTR
jgi:GTP-binding protein HflX